MLIMMIGAAGSGKSRYVKRHLSHLNVVCPDDIRMELNGNLTDQTNNQRVWEISMAQLAGYLEARKDVVLDATGLQRWSRLRILQLVPANCKVLYLVVIRPLRDKIRDRGWRPESLVINHDTLFYSKFKEIVDGDDDPRVRVEYVNPNDPDHYDF